MASQSVTDPPAPRPGGKPRRDARTVTLLIVGRIASEQGDGLCRIRNISAGGLMAEVFTPFAVGEPARIELRNSQVVTGTVRWVKDGALGLEFDTPVEDIKQLLADPEPARRKPEVPLVRAPRLPTDCSVDIQLLGRHYLGAVMDLSQGGARLATSAPLVRDQLLTLSIVGLPHLRAAVRWVGEEEGGVAFLEPIAFATLAHWLNDPALRHNRRG